MKTSICLPNNPKETVHASACCCRKTNSNGDLKKGCGSACTMATNGRRGVWKENKVGKREECNQQRERERERPTKTTFPSVNSPVCDPADLTLMHQTDRTGVGHPRALPATPLYQPIHLSASLSCFLPLPLLQRRRFCH